MIFTADLHGRREHYEELFSLAAARGAGTIAIGGDLGPHAHGSDGIARQREFLTGFLLPRIDRFAQEVSGARVLLMMGNDDWSANLEVLISNTSEHFQILDGKGTLLDDGTKIVGYPFVPITPFGLKDWEKWDNRLTGGENFIGMRSVDGGIERASMEDRRDETLEKDLVRIAEETGLKDFIFVSHSPPYETALDLVAEDVHVGSLAIREFIEKRSPKLSLHGHIHESPRISGRYREKLGRTLCVNPGQSLSSGLHAVIFDVEDPEGTMSHTIFK